MIKGIGIDIVYLDIIKTMVEARSGDSLRDVYTNAEIELCRSSPNSVERFATRFAAKEATMKAFGLGWQADGLDWTDIEVTNDDVNQPSLLLKGEAELKAKKLGVQKVWLSLTHEENVGVALVILEG
jgi:holo-[acyl-carrier protein] synthase